ncbi:MAG: flagellar biosynthesis protein FlhB [Lachnospiraceae bacterium]|nr:flagellar biosynthesis protein FlhB [Lachnospiraceae bacterium]
MLELDLQFFAKEGPGGEKTEEPTSKKLEDARKEGQVAKSKEFASSLTLLAFFLLLRIWMTVLATQLKELFGGFYNRFGYFAGMASYEDRHVEYSTLVSYALLRVFVIIAPFLISGFVLCFVADLAQVKWKPTSKPLQPKLSKINPINGLKRIFSVQKLVELIKSVVKIAIVVIVVYNQLKDKWPLIFNMYDMPLLQGVMAAGKILIDTGFLISLIFMVVAFADFGFQKWKFHQDMKMTKQEVKEEYKSTEGDPQIKGKIKQKMMEASRRRMMQSVPQADVVITNPTHYAVALRYDKEIAPAPFVVAKGVDHIAQKIKEIARENDVEIMENKPLARALYSNVDLGEQIPEELYVAVAEVLAAVYKATGRV